MLIWLKLVGLLFSGVFSVMVVNCCYNKVCLCCLCRCIVICVVLCRCRNGILLMCLYNVFRLLKWVSSIVVDLVFMLVILGMLLIVLLYNVR